MRRVCNPRLRGGKLFRDDALTKLRLEPTRPLRAARSRGVENRFGVESAMAGRATRRCSAPGVRPRCPPPVDIAKLSRDQAEVVRRYPPHSVGAAFQVYIRTDEWASRALSARNKVWWPAWCRIRDMWGDVDPNSIEFAMMSRWRSALERAHGRNVAHKTLRSGGRCGGGGYCRRRRCGGVVRQAGEFNRPIEHAAQDLCAG
jgi:hypothetical protein